MVGLWLAGMMTCSAAVEPPPGARDPFADAIAQGWSRDGAAWIAGSQAQPLMPGQSYANFRLLLHYVLPEGTSRNGGWLRIGPGYSSFLGPAPNGRWIDLDYEHTDGSNPVVRFWVNGNLRMEKKVPVGTASLPSAKGFGLPGIPTDFQVQPVPGLRLTQAWIQPLDRVDHASLLASNDTSALLRGQTLYQELCVICHGTPEKEGFLPTALRFHQGTFKNGFDPYRMFLTLTHGFGQMVPQNQYSPRQKYDVIHFIRETLLRPHNPSQFVSITPDYLAGLPRRMTSLPPEAPREERPPQYKLMDFGPALFWTLEVAPGNIAYKGIAIRLDPGPGGVSKGRAWMLYDHDTLRAAAAWSGEGFVDWSGIAFDGSHGTHTHIRGSPTFINPVGPGWASPAATRAEAAWADPRLRGRDGKPYGPLPRDWAHLKGFYLHGDRAVLRYSVGDANILESPGFIDYGTAPVFVRSLNIGKSTADLTLRLAPDTNGLSIAGAGAAISSLSGFKVARIPASATPCRVAFYFSRLDPASLEALARGNTPEDLEPLTRGGPPRWPQIIETQAKLGSDSGPFAVDTLTHPESSANPWESWMRLGGFDFFEDTDRAAVCTWMGDVWIVSGLDAQPLGTLRWRRIATGLFQPLGLKIVEGTIYVCCRDQIARLRDLNGDGEIDLVENFNNDHQVTEHFHEFAMGLQRDDTGNFYYAKSARHALPALVPHHGTLLRVSPDGSRTDILAKGFRAANGVCLNPDGTFFVTDQEGHWNPKNRINWVRGDGRFYGNMMAYHEVADESDAAMDQPLCWITNEHDRSPAELLWVPNHSWGPLGGRLLNLSYGYGKIYVVPYEHMGASIQGGLCALPIPNFPTGIMRGRFHPKNGHLHVCGLFAWAGSQTEPGGFYRVRVTGKPMHLPVELHALPGALTIEFTDPLDSATASDPSRYAVKVWSLKRTKNYGSQHYDEHPLKVERATLTAGGKGVRLDIPALAPTWCMEIRCRLHTPDGQDIECVLHNTIHQLEKPSVLQ